MGNDRGAGFRANILPLSASFELPLLRILIRYRGSVPEPVNTVLEAFFLPLRCLDERVPAYRALIDAEHQLLGLQ